MELQQNKNKAIQALEFLLILDIITLIVLWLLIGYLAAVFNLIKI